MAELLRHLEANGFTTYIASGGDRDFMRSFANPLYGMSSTGAKADGWTVVSVEDDWGTVFAGQ